jgi:hypothetical protein
MQVLPTGQAVMTCFQPGCCFVAVCFLQMSSRARLDLSCERLHSLAVRYTEKQVHSSVLNLYAI